MKRILAMVLAVMMIATMLVACGGPKDALEGNWTCQDPDYGTVVWTFDGEGNCTLDNDIMSQEGTYTIKDDKLVDITMSLWDEAIEYEYVSGEGTLKLTATNGYSVDYDLVAK